MISNTWQLQEAKNKFSSLVEKAIQIGPQIVTKRGEDVVVILNVADYKKLISPLTKLTDFFKNSPLTKVELNIQRSKEETRNIEL
jgi:antitoxin Phd